jgi:hypothetical protein
MIMHSTVDADSLHRTAKYFMDSGKAASQAEAMAMLSGFGLTVYVGDELVDSVAQQVALLSLINLGHRTLLGGVDVVGVPDGDNLTALTAAATLGEAIVALGGRCVATANVSWPVAVIGNATAPQMPGAGWRLTWSGWRGGVVPLRDDYRLADDDALALAPMVAAACLMTEVFSYHAGDHPMAGRRAVGLSLWAVDADWREDVPEPAIGYLPSRLWMIGLGNLGQAYCWALAGLPYADRSTVELILQDFDTLATSNVSTSVLTFPDSVGSKKARMAAKWLERIGFTVSIEERRFGSWTKREVSEPGLALCGVDNALARAALEDAGFDLVVEAGLGAGPDSFRGISLHTFPGERAARDIWSGAAPPAVATTHMPAYAALAADGMDECGLAILASRTVGVPFVGLIAAAMVIGELLRRLHGGRGYDLIATAADTLDDVVTVPAKQLPYNSGHVPAQGA